MRRRDLFGRWRERLKRKTESFMRLNWITKRSVVLYFVTSFFFVRYKEI